MAKVSVIVPVYNAEKYLKQCLDSIVNQTLKDIEIVIINDGSTDRSGEICKSYLSDSRVIYYEKQNEGLAAARQDGTERSNGDYIGFVDSDDWVEVDMYEKMYSAANENNADIVFCNCVENEDGYRFTPEMSSGVYDRSGILDEILPKTLAYVSKDGGKRAIRWSNCLRIYKRSTILNNNIKFDRRLRRSQDLQFTYEMTLASNSFYYMGDDYFYHNRVVSDSLSRGYTKNLHTLYTYLIDDLFGITENFKERDYSEQMNLRAFFFITDCIENELKPLCPNSRDEKIRIIEDIMNDPVCERFYGHIPVEKLNALLKAEYDYIHKKDAQGLLDFADKYNAQEQKRKRRDDKKRAVMDFLTESAVVGTVYKKLRHKK